MDRFNLGKVSVEGLGKKIYEQGIAALKGVMYLGNGTRKRSVLDLDCSQSHVRDFIGEGFNYAGLDPKLNFERDGQKFLVIDTAGVRKKRKMADDIEFYGYTRALRSINRADVVLISSLSIIPSSYAVGSFSNLFFS